MIIPCIDLMGGKAVQLVRGRRPALSVDDLAGLLEKFSGYKRLHVIDLDAAMRKGTNGRCIKRICKASKAGVRVGGGIRTVARAVRILSWGAEKIIVGSAAFRGGAINTRFLAALTGAAGKKRIILALDTEGGRIVVHGWRERLRLRPQDVISRLEPHCSEFLSTYVDKEGTMKGTNLAWFRELRRLTALPITAAGGIRSRREVEVLEALGIHAAVGMALYVGKLA